MSDAVLELSGITQTFHQGGTALEVLRGIDLTVAAGEIVALVGPSGAGKSTLLQIAGLLETPGGGTISICGRAAAKLGDRDRTALRRAHLGFVYQYHHLLPEFSAEENVILPQMIAGADKAAARALANDPELLLADEPTGNLDPGTAGEVFDLLIKRVRDSGLAALIATHNPDLAARMDRTLRLGDGRLAAGAAPDSRPKAAASGETR